MSNTRFVVIENFGHLVHARVKLLVSLGYARDHIWPPDDTQIVTSWDDALTTIVSLQRQGWDPTSSECYLLCDLALDETNRTAEEGIAQLINAREQLRDYIVIALTTYAGKARRLLGAGADYILDASMLDGVSGMYILELTLQQARSAWGIRTAREIIPIPAPYVLRDSPGVRALLAALPKEVITLLTKLECLRWTDITIQTLTGGYSGAHILRLEGLEDAAPRSLVCKIARRSEVLTAEAERTKLALESYKIYVGRIAPYVEMTPKPLGAEAWYAVQSTVPGDTLEQALLSSHPGDTRIDSFFADLEVMLDAIEERSVRERPAVAALKIGDIDIERFNTTLPVLMAITERCRDRGWLSSSILSSTTASQMLKLVSSWNDIVAERYAVTPQYEQHGDFNPRNIFLASNGFQLIDFARFGYWPAAYDLVRLELQLLLRAVDRLRELDSLPQRLPRWVEFAAAVESETEDLYPATTTDDEEDLILTSLFRRIRQLILLRQRLLTRLTPKVEQRPFLALQRVFDAIKICSYQDASAFKRVWFLHIAAQNAAVAGIL